MSSSVTAALEAAVVVACVCRLHLASWGPLTASLLLLAVQTFYTQPKWGRLIGASPTLGAAFRSGSASACGLLAGGLAVPLVAAALAHRCAGTAAKAAAVSAALSSSLLLSLTSLVGLLLTRPLPRRTCAIYVATTALAVHALRGGGAGADGAAAIAGLLLASAAFLLLLLVALPGSLSLGEALVVAEGLGAPAHCLATWTVASGGGAKRDELTSVLLVVSAGAVVAGAVFSLLFRFMTSNHLARAVYFYGLCLVFALGILLPWLQHLFHSDPLLWLADFLSRPRDRRYTLAYWAFLLAGAVALAAALGGAAWPAGGALPRTAARKAFHAFAVAAFLPGLARDRALLHLASVAAAAAFLGLEYARAFDVRPLGGILRASLPALVDERDSGPLVLTHIYLLLGMALPLWLSWPACCPLAGAAVGLPSLAPYAGVLALGVGDAVASVFGSGLGCCRWPGTCKTVEGTVASVFAQVMVLALVAVADGAVRLGSEYAAVLVCVTLAALLEAFTAQIDNLLLPLYAFALFLA
ncbi:dolichol kinase [Petromyzon marinus]|uniref:dolichol kinase n=1 Tax=Petromyzon marinus TaxID=7757 RepID=A0AAJ7XD88_PETMA|nr:dolichol kinase [Petromyzon marinus]